MEPAGKTYQLKLAQFRDAVDGFSQAVAVEVEDKDPVVADLINNGKVQKFEYCIELAWKLAQRYLFDVHGLERNSPKSAAKGLLEVQAIDDALYQRIIEMIYDRNLLSHLYDMENFTDILKRLTVYKESLRLLGEKLRV